MPPPFLFYPFYTLPTTPSRTIGITSSANLPAFFHTFIGALGLVANDVSVTRPNCIAQTSASHFSRFYGNLVITTVTIVILFGGLSLYGKCRTKVSSSSSQWRKFARQRRTRAVVVYLFTSYGTIFLNCLSVTFCLPQVCNCCPCLIRDLFRAFNTRALCMFFIFPNQIPHFFVCLCVSSRHAGCWPRSVRSSASGTCTSRPLPWVW